MHNYIKASALVLRLFLTSIYCLSFYFLCLNHLNTENLVKAGIVTRQHLLASPFRAMLGLGHRTMFIRVRVLRSIYEARQTWT